jgi:hypothetical protein
MKEQIAVLSEVVRNLRRYKVNELVIRHTVINTAANLAGNDYDAVLDAVIGKDEEADQRILAKLRRSL